LIQLADGVSARVSLSVTFIGDFPVVQSQVEQIGHFNGTSIGAVAASGAGVQVNMASLLVNNGGEIALFTAYLLDFTERQELNIYMPADLDQFRGDNSHGTVIGGECLVKLRHGPANG